jgi:hypothetical protein
MCFFLHEILGGLASGMAAVARFLFMALGFRAFIGAIFLAVIDQAVAVRVGAFHQRDNRHRNSSLVSSRVEHFSDRAAVFAFLRAESSFHVNFGLRLSPIIFWTSGPRIALLGNFVSALLYFLKSRVNPHFANS